jgi:hypothetical protein
MYESVIKQKTMKQTRGPTSDITTIKSGFLAATASTRIYYLLATSKRSCGYIQETRYYSLSLDVCVCVSVCRLYWLASDLARKPFYFVVTACYSATTW